MTKVVKAKEVLKSYHQIGFRLQTRLAEIDFCVFNKKVLVLGLFYKTKKQIYLSNELAQQIINYNISIDMQVIF